MIDILIRFFAQSGKETKGKAPEGVCPNCWGEQEYDNKIRAMYVDKQIDVSNYKANYAFIQDFVINQIDGITLVKSKNRLECPNCKAKLSIQS
ncbi:MAG: hypothetical protein QNK30_04965 [Bacteroidales bacterium]|nr:hypothetical protein [Bacteroidales bacterium]